MSQLEYLVPDTLDEALELLEKGIPLAGGSALTPRRKELKAVIDLRNLGLDSIRVRGNNIEIGAATKLQAIVDSNTPLPTTLREVCKLEAGWNLRNMATLGGAIMSSDARSALLTTLLALNAQILQAPSHKASPLHEVLDVRDKVKLITAVQFTIPTHLLYEQVARTPADVPLVCVAIGLVRVQGKDEITIGIGGVGSRPLQLMEAKSVSAEKQNFEVLVRAAKEAYKNAKDHWASAEYRSETAGVLVNRLLKEVQS